MDWAHFWGPNLLQATLFASLSAVVGTAVGLIVRTWFKNFSAQLFGEQVKATTAAEAAASRAADAIDASQQAREHASTAGENSRQANEAVMWLANELSKANAGNEYLKTRVDDLLAALAVEQASRGGIPTPTGPIGQTGEEGETTITGRHRLHTNMIPTGRQDDYV